VAQGIDMIDAVVVTHGHADHIMGMDDVRRFNALRHGPLDVWAERATHEVLTRCFGYAFMEPARDLKLFRPHLVRREISDALESFEIGAMRWRPMRLFHGKMPILGFRIGRVAYCTDVNRIPEESFGLLEDLDVLVLDALQYRPHSTHFSLDEALAVVERVKPKATRFTHIAHALGHAATNAKLPSGVQLGYDGERVVGRGE
jgi:phosphoribosyl 1,2-cyclic phosphate phosphodiesterase